jgi:MipA family protein
MKTSGRRGRREAGYFGINATQSFNSGYAQYYPGAGLRSVGVGTSATGVAFGSYNRLTDIAAGSPLVSGPAGSPNQFVVAFRMVMPALPRSVLRAWSL